MSTGQYRHPRGIFFGGRAPVWSQRTLRTIVQQHLADARRVAIIDLHTGLGPFGHGELIASHPDAAGKARLAACFDDYTVPAEGNSVSADVQGDVLDAHRAVAARRRASPGSRSSGGPSTSSRCPTRCAPTRGSTATPIRAARAAAPIKEQLRAAFAPDDPRWAELVVDRFVGVRDRAVAGLVGG